MNILIILLSVALNLGPSDFTTFKILSAKTVAHSFTGYQRNYMVGADTFFMEEIWKDIDRYIGIYQVSNMGRVKSLSRTIIRKNGVPRPISERILKEGITTSGYAQVVLYKGTSHYNESIHRMVATAFIPNPENKPQVNHINGIRTDNRLVNLEWCTVSENHLHSFRYLGKIKVSPSLGKFGGDNHLSKKVNQIDIITGQIIATYNGVAECSRITGIRKENIAAVCRGNSRQKTAGGFKWEYICSTIV